MFSWIDYFQNETNEILNEKNGIKILKKSNLCTKINESVYSNTNCDAKRNMCIQKKPIEQTRSRCQIISNNNSKQLQIKPCSKILDLSPEEREKIAALIRELGILQSEKERVSHELNTERNKFQLELTSMERMYKSTLEDKVKLEEELRKKDDAFKKLKFEELTNSKISPEISDFKDGFVVVPKRALKGLELHSELSPKTEIHYPGPPQSSRSQIITSELLRAHSLQSVDNSYNSDNRSLIAEQKELLVEKRYLNLVLKQQKCLKKLKNKISKLEHNDVRMINSQSDNISDKSSMKTDSVDLVTPRTLNGSSPSQSIPLSIVSSTPTVAQSISPMSDVVHANDSAILRNDDILLITALNHGIKESHITIDSPPRPLSGLTSVRAQSPSESLFHVIDSLEDIKLSRDYNYNNPTELTRPIPPVCAEDDLLNDLFFNI